MNYLTKAIAAISPERGLARVAAATKIEMLEQRRAALAGSGNYEPTGGGKRASEFRTNSQSAMAAMRGDRGPLSFIARDMLRNNARVVRANNLISNYVVGKGIVPVITMKSGEDDKNKSKIDGLIRDHLYTQAIDADGQNNLFGMQALSMETVPLSGEVLLRARWRKSTDGLPLPLQVQVLECDFLDDAIDGTKPNGVTIENGIEYSPIGKILAYHLHTAHPGGLLHSRGTARITPENIAHSFLSTRPGQRRGISWYAPVMTELHDQYKFMVATLKRQEVAAMFAGIFKSGEPLDGDLELSAGSILNVGAEENIDFNDPPSADAAAPIMKMIDGVIASGLMLPVEALTGDYSGVSYSGGRMGRMDTDPTVARWQNHLMIPQQCQRVGGWFKEAVELQTFIDRDSYTLDWAVQARPVLDPTKDYPATIKKISGGLTSRRAEIRKLGEDPDKVDAEIAEERKWATEKGIKFSSDANAGDEKADSSVPNKTK